MIDRKGLLKEINHMLDCGPKTFTPIFEIFPKLLAEKYGYNSLQKQKNLHNNLVRDLRRKGYTCRNMSDRIIIKVL